MGGSLRARQPLTDETQPRDDERWTLADERWVTVQGGEGQSRYGEGRSLTSDGFGLKREGITEVCLEVVRGCLGLSDVPGGVGGRASLTRRLGGQECGVEWV